MDGAAGEVNEAASLCVLASGSAGNCGVLAVGRRGARRVVLIDAGLSPRRTRRELATIGLSLDQVCAVLVTHLDGDHWRPEWRTAMPADVPVLMSPRHLQSGRRQGLLPDTADSFDAPIEPTPGVRVHPLLLAHDALGVSSFRVEAGGGTLGYATDVGRVTDELVEHLRGVEVLAIESNYCRRMQIESGRPAFLKRRIMGGRGHLSNDEAAAAVAGIGPRRHVVFLHLSRQCNRGELVAGMHVGADYEFTISDQFRPTRWVRIGVARGEPARTLWEAAQ
jgi:phosphoribosyl 1,2-cyclic phosphodiesterase